MLLSLGWILLIDCDELVVGCLCVLSNQAGGGGSSSGAMGNLLVGPVGPFPGAGRTTTANGLSPLLGGGRRMRYH